MNHNLTKDKVYNIVEKVFYYESFNFNFVLYEFHYFIVNNNAEFAKRRLCFFEKLTFFIWVLATIWYSF